MTHGTQDEAYLSLLYQTPPAATDVVSPLQTQTLSVWCGACGLGASLPSDSLVPQGRRLQLLG